MRIGIISDTHDQVARTSKAVARLVSEGAEVLMHCGDLTGPEVVYECATVPAYFVFGNNDYDIEPLQRAMKVCGSTCLGRGGTLELDGRIFALTHGDSDREIRRLTALEPDYLLSGHSHLVHDEQRGVTRFINPGALHRAPIWTVALLDTSTDMLSLLQIDEDRR